MAALFACGSDAVLSHTTAAWLWNLLSHPAPVHVTISPRRTVRRTGIEIYRSTVDPRDIRTRHRLCLTSPPRTILDLAASLDDYELERLVGDANYRRLASDAELRDQLDRARGKRGALRLRRILGRPGGVQRTRSPAEREMLRLLRDAAITGFEANARVHGYEVDFLWREVGVVVEVDGYDAHSGRVAFERDRLKWGRLEASGLRVISVTGRQIRSNLDGVLGRLRRILNGPAADPRAGG